LESGSETRNIINAIGNAKRALHLQVETICVGYGYKSKSKDFPPKLSFLKDLGIVAPKIIEKLNRIRNRIEHEYYCPNLDETNDFIDVVELFLYATFDFIAIFPDETIFEIGDGDNSKEAHTNTGLPEHIRIEIKKNAGKLSVYNLHWFDGREEELILAVDVSQKEYFEWVRKLFALLFFLPL